MFTGLKTKNFWPMKLQHIVMIVAITKEKITASDVINSTNLFDETFS